MTPQYLIRLARTPLTAVLVTALAGCAVGPNYSRPSAPLSATFKEAPQKTPAPADGFTQATPADALDKGDWWTLFGDPVLSDLEAKVQVSNQNIIAAEAAYRQARAIVREQQGALFPTIDLNGSATKSGGNSRSGGGTTTTTGGTTTTSSGATSTVVSTSSTSTKSYRASIGGSWEIDVWGRIRRTIEAAKANAQASEADLANARLSAQGELAVDYFGLRQADTDLLLDQRTVAGYQRTLKIAQNQYNAGVSAKSDELQAQTQLANAQADLAGVEQTRATYEHAIAVLTGQAPGNFSLASVPNWSSKTPDVPPGVPSTLLQRRPDIAAAERRAKAANAEIGVAVAAFFPDLTLTGSYGFASSELSHLLTSPNSVWSYGASVVETVFNGGTRIAQVSAARAAYDQSVAQYRQTVLEALADVENQLVAARVLANQYAFRLEASKAADQAEQIVLNRYQAGQISYTDVVTAQVSAASSRSALAQAAAQRQTTAAALIQSLGGGWRAPAK